MRRARRTRSSWPWSKFSRLARSLGANVGAIRANNFPRQADGHGQATDDHPSSWTNPDDAERLTGIYGSAGWGFGPSKRAAAFALGRQRRGPPGAEARGHRQARRRAVVEHAGVPQVGVVEYDQRPGGRDDLHLIGVRAHTRPERQHVDRRLAHPVRAGNDPQRPVAGG